MLSIHDRSVLSVDQVVSWTVFGRPLSGTVIRRDRLAPMMYHVLVHGGAPYPVLIHRDALSAHRRRA